jgi:hypothetical protein
LLAYSADKGEKLLDLAIGRFGAGPPITYLLDGKQQIAMMAGSGRRPGAGSPAEAKVENPPLLYVFELDGKAPLPIMVAPPGPIGPPPPAASPKKGQ